MTAARVDRVDHHPEISIQHGDQVGNRDALGQAGEAAEVEIEDHRVDPLERAALDLARQHPPASVMAQVGAQQIPRDPPVRRRFQRQPQVRQGTPNQAQIAVREPVRMIAGPGGEHPLGRIGGIEIRVLGRFLERQAGGEIIGRAACAQLVEQGVSAVMPRVGHALAQLRLAGVNDLIKRALQPFPARRGLVGKALLRHAAFPAQPFEGNPAKARVQGPLRHVQTIERHADLRQLVAIPGQQLLARGSVDATRQQPIRQVRRGRMAGTGHAKAPRETRVSIT